MSEEMKRCPFCGEEILAIAIKCKHCGSALEEEKGDSTAQAEESTPKKKVSAIKILIPTLLAVLFLFFCNFHIITGGGVGFMVVMRDSFGLNEVFINVDTITNMPWLAAKSKYPIGCKILQREGIIESDAEFNARMESDREEDYKKIMQETEQRLRDMGY